jgi:hypothetical protein
LRSGGGGGSVVVVVVGRTHCPLDQAASCQRHWPPALLRCRRSSMYHVCVAPMLPESCPVALSAVCEAMPSAEGLFGSALVAYRAGSKPPGAVSVHAARGGGFVMSSRHFGRLFTADCKLRGAWWLVCAFLGFSGDRRAWYRALK